MESVLLARDPVPVVAVQLAEPATYRPEEDALARAVWQALGAELPELLGPGCRAVELDRLPYLLEHGVDVQPTDAVIWVSYLSKALEYGGDLKAVMVFDAKHLQCTFQEVASSTSPCEVNAIARVYQTRLSSEDGTMLWFSRLPSADRRVASPYEVAHGRWIPGDPWLALRIILVIGSLTSNVLEHTTNLLAQSGRFATAQFPPGAGRAS